MLGANYDFHTDSQLGHFKAKPKGESKGESKEEKSKE